MEKYSVLMSLYKEENPEYFHLAIDSMLNQTVKPDEIVVVEDGPLSDELYAVIKEYTTKYPDLFTIVANEKNIGLGLALNLGLAHCKNELVARMDSDDISKPERCKKQLILFRQRPELSIVGSWVDEFSGNVDNIISTRKVPCSQVEIYEYAKRRSAFNHPTVMYRKSAVLANNGYLDLRRNQDVDLFGRMLFFGCKATNIGEALLWFRSNDDLAKRRKSWENTKSYINIIKKFWRIGYSGFTDYAMIATVQMAIFLMPVKLQHIVYKIILRK